MSIRALTLATALGLSLAAPVAAAFGDQTTSAGATAAAERTAERSGLKHGKCVRAWNANANSAAQNRLLAIFAEPDASGNVVVGSEDGKCVLAAYNVAQPKYAIFTRSGRAYAKTGKGPGDEFNEYRNSINPLDVILQPSGKIKPVQ